MGAVRTGSSSGRPRDVERLARAPQLLFNEKVLCGLGRGLGNDGHLNLQGVESALINLGRFVRIAKAMGVERLDMLATAAVRDAVDGVAFTETVRKRWGQPVRILSGSEEARLSALGVVSGIGEADGLMGDLGGGSVELVRLDPGELWAYVHLRP